MKRCTDAAAVVDFRKRHGLTQGALDKMLGFSSNGLAVARWERENAPYYATLLFALVDALGIDLLRQLGEEGVKPSDRNAVIAFRKRHNLRGRDLEHLLGFKSYNGRTTRRWEDPAEKGAPGYVTVLMAYCDAYGLKVLEDIAKANEAA